MTAKTKISEILEAINVFKTWKWQNLIVISVLILGSFAIYCFTNITKADSEKIDSLYQRIDAMETTIDTLNATIRTLNLRLISYEKLLENYEKIRDYRLKIIEDKLGIKYKEGGNNHYEKDE